MSKKASLTHNACYRKNMHRKGLYYEFKIEEGIPEAIYLRYRRSSRKKKAAILDEFCAACGYHRKHAIRILRKFTRFIKQPKKKRGRTPLYSKGAILKPLKKIWLSANLPCSKRLKAVLPLWLPGYIQEYGDLPPGVTESLLTMSASTMDRILKPVRVNYKGRGKSTTKPGTLLRKQIPIKTNQWDESRPGFLEADTVAHCGTCMSGMFAFTLDCVDIATGWTEQRAVWGKGETDVLAQIKDIEVSLPFPLLGFDSDKRFRVPQSSPPQTLYRKTTPGTGYQKQSISQR